MKGSILPVIYICIASSCCLSGGCDDAMEYPPKMAVIEGTFSSEGYPVVLFSSSVVPAEEGNISDALINWGKVTISDGEREVILSGRKDNSFLPRFYYYSQAITGEPGKTYTVRARFKDLYAESTVRMPFPTAIDSITFSSTDVDTLRATTVHFTSPSDVPAYYYITLHNPVRGSHPMPCLMGTI
ncbi:MAG: DUF4249 domain-containing protein, partial [Muribaculaceae bacterium]|nr:DUF4249 domain-containing protein [Muribaculaceae bacterium]